GQQLIEIAKALSVDARLLVLDEPTAALTSTEITQLFEIMRRLRDSGVGMVFISHHLEEITEIADTVTVLRDGTFVDQVPAGTPEDRFVRLMVGRSIEALFPRRTPTLGQRMLHVDGLTAAGRFAEISLSV